MKTLAFAFIFLLSFVILASAETTFTITSEGSHTVQTSATSDTILRIRIPGMFQRTGLALVPTSLPAGLAAFDFIGQFCAPAFKLFTYAVADAKFDYQTCNDCNGTEVMFGSICPDRHWFTCDYFITVPLRQDLTFSFELSLAGSIMIEEVLLPPGAQINLVGETIPVNTYRVFRVDSPDGPLKHWSVQMSGSGLDYSVSRYPSTTSCGWNGPAILNHNIVPKQSITQFDFGAECYFEIDSTAYITVWNSDPATPTTFNMTATFSTSTRTATAAVSLGETYNGATPAAGATYITLDLQSTAFPNATEITVCVPLANNPIQSAVVFEILSNSAENRCQEPFGTKTTIIEGVCTKQRIESQCDGSFPTVLTLRVASFSNYSIAFSVQPSAVGMVGYGVVDPGQQFLTYSNTTNLARVLGSSSWTSGYLDVVFENFKTTTQTIYAKMSSEDGCGSWYSSCLAAAGGTCKSHAFLCGFEGSVSDLYYRTAMADAGITVVHKEFVEMTDGMTLDVDVPGARAPVGLAGPLLVTISAAPAGFTWQAYIEVVPSGQKCLADPFIRDCLVGENLPCNLTILCESDVLIVKFNDASRPMTLNFQPVAPVEIDAISSATPSRAISNPESPGAHEWFRISVPPASIANKNNITLHVRETNDYLVGRHIGTEWHVRVGGCKLQRLFPECSAGDICAAVIQLGPENTVDGALWIRALTTESVISATIELVSAFSGCTTLTPQSSPTCGSSLRYSVFPQPDYYHQTMLEVGAAQFVQEVKVLFPEHSLDSTPCGSAIAQIACAANYFACAANPATGVPSGVPVLCLEWCNDVLTVCPTSVAANISALVCAYPTPSCSEMIIRPDFAPAAEAPAAPAPVADAPTSSVSAPSISDGGNGGTPGAAPTPVDSGSPTTNTVHTGVASSLHATAVTFAVLIVIASIVLLN